MMVAGEVGVEDIVAVVGAVVFSEEHCRQVAVADNVTVDGALGV